MKSADEKIQKILLYIKEAEKKRAQNQAIQEEFDKRNSCIAEKINDVKAKLEPLECARKDAVTNAGQGKCNSEGRLH